MPKLGMGPIRREQICRAASTVIAEVGFAGTTMRLVAEQAGVSTGMINHYFQNREDMLCQALVFVSERMQERQRQAVEGLPPEERLKAFLEGSLPYDEEQLQTWKVWINAYSEAVRSPKLRQVIHSRLEPWYVIINHVLEAAPSARSDGGFPASWRLDALMNGLAIQVLVADTPLGLDEVRDEIIRLTMLDPGV